MRIAAILQTRLTDTRKPLDVACVVRYYPHAGANAPSQAFGGTLMSPASKVFREFYAVVEKRLDEESRLSVANLCHATGLNSLDVCWYALQYGLWMLAHSSDVMATMRARGHPEEYKAAAEAVEREDATE